MAAGGRFFASAELPKPPNIEGKEPPPTPHPHNTQHHKRSPPSEHSTTTHACTRRDWASANGGGCGGCGGGCGGCGGGGAQGAQGGGGVVGGSKYGTCAGQGGRAKSGKPSDTPSRLTLGPDARTKRGAAAGHLRPAKVKDLGPKPHIPAPSSPPHPSPLTYALGLCATDPRVRRRSLGHWEWMIIVRRDGIHAANCWASEPGHQADRVGRSGGVGACWRARVGMGSFGHCQRHRASHLQCPAQLERDGDHPVTKLSFASKLSSARIHRAKQRGLCARFAPQPFECSAPSKCAERQVQLSASTGCLGPPHCMMRP